MKLTSLRPIALLRPIAFGLIALATSITAIPANAGYDRDLYRAADDYRDAVVDFERHAQRLHGHIDRFTLRLVDRLEDASGDLRSATRRSDDVSRLLFEFNEVQSLQPRVEQAVFGSGCPIVSAALAQHWNEVLAAYGGLQYRISFMQSIGFGVPHQSHRAPAPSCGVGNPYGVPETRFQRVAPSGSIALPTPSNFPRQDLSRRDPRSNSFNPGAAMLQSLLMRAFR